MSTGASKLAKFKARADAHGQAATLYRHVSHPSGAYIDPLSGHPDPESTSYPAAVPQVTYTPVQIKGFLQSVPSIIRGGEMYRNRVAGEDIEYDMIFYGPGDQVIAVHDRLVVGNVAFEVNRVGPHRDGETVVMYKCSLVKVTDLDWPPEEPEEPPVPE